MPSNVSLGSALWMDGPSLDAGAPFRAFGVATSVYTGGTATAVAVPGGVFPGMGAMGVSASSGLNVQVAAGYCCVPHPTAGQGGYVFGALTAQTLSLAAADPANPRIDLIVARVYDTANSASFCDVEVVEGTAATPATTPATPAAAIALASVSVPAAAVALASGAVTDLRTYVVSPGGVLPIANSAAAPAVPATQIMYDLSRDLLVQGTGAAGSTALLNSGPWTPALAEKTSNVSDSSGRGNLTTILSESVTVDGSTDLEIYYKWAGLYVTSAPLLVTMSVSLDGTVLDQTNLYAQSTSSSSPANGSAARYFTSSGAGTTPSAGTHTITFSFQSASSSATTTVVCSSTAIAALRVAPTTA